MQVGILLKSLYEFDEVLTIDTFDNFGLLSFVSNLVLS
jgi:hypothetical protein